jgi:peptide/nickel transport system permease protein
VLRYVVRRLLWTGLTVLFVSVLTFLLVFAGPTDPARALVGERAQGVSVEQVRKRYGIDQPLHVQYLHYMAHLARGDLGDSYYFNRPVREVLFERFPATALLAVSIMLVAVLLGIPMGVVAALRSNTLADRGLMTFGLLAISMPTFFFGLILLYLFAFQLKLFPVGGFGTPAHVVLPALTVGLPWAAWYAIVLRSSMLDVIAADYARTAHAKGLGEWLVARRHLLRNALLPVVTMLGVDMAGLLTGLALVEYIFGWPGIGWQALQAAQRYDIPMIMGSVLFGALLIGLANLVVDVAYTWLDPRVRLT